MSLDYFKEKNIWFIWIIAFLVRIVLCFFEPNIYPEELGTYYILEGFKQIPVSFNTALLYAIFTQNNSLLLISLVFGYVNWFIMNPLTDFLFPAIISPFYAIGGIIGVRIFLAAVSSLGVITFNFFIKELTRNEELITISTILYGFNLIGVYFAGQVSTANIFYTLIPLILFLFLKQINSTHIKNYILDPVQEPKKTLNIYIILAGLLVFTFNLGLIVPVMYACGLVLWILYSDSRDKLIKELIYLIVIAAVPAVILLVYGIMIDHPLAGVLNYSSIIIWKSLDGSAVLYYILGLGIAVALYLPFVFMGILSYDKDKLNKFFMGWLILLQILCFGSANLDANMKYIMYSLPMLMYFTIQGYEEQEGQFSFIKKENYPYLYIVVSFVIALLLILITKVIIV
ncbi:MAG: hypothetical protein ACTSRG_05765 [Candidatus Helarchaeota archaeon]